MDFGEEKREHSDSNKALKVQNPADGVLTLTADVGQYEDTMRYAGFWTRLVAGLIDAIVFMPLMLLYIWIQSRSYAGILIYVLPYWFCAAFYNIVLLARYGQTLGKMALRIKVTRVDGSDIGFKEACLRHSIDAIFGFLSGIGMIIAILVTGPDIFTGAYTWIEQTKIIAPNTPAFAEIAKNMSKIWIWSELIVLLFNKKRRAIHDFIAGTVVIHAQK